MLEILRARKEQLKERGVKGFTLMEMLIVIAIIAILIAIAIPIFTSQLARANAATDEANIRSGYAQVQSEIILATNKSSLPASYTLNIDGTVTAGGTAYETKGTSTDLPEAASGVVKIGGIDAQWSSGQSVVYTLNTDKTAIDQIQGQ